MGKLGNKIIIITKLQGGLGNQMFQYAIGWNLAKKNNTDLKFDLSFYNKQQKGFLKRNYSLNYFNIKEKIATETEIKKLKKYKWKKGRRHFFHNLFFANNSIYIKEKQFNFNPKILKIKNFVYLDGYWQSEKYFENIKNIIRKEFILKNKFQIKDTKLKKTIKNTKSVSLHIRRTDYLIAKKNVYYSCPLDYYYKAIEKIAKKYSNLHIFVFSDDIKWTKDNLKTKFPITFIGGNKDYEDLILMSLCKHNIIANSSFSWWGAWLNSNPNKIVIAPKKWFNITINTDDLIPNSWIKI